MIAAPLHIRLRYHVEQLPDELLDWRGAWQAAEARCTEYRTDRDVWRAMASLAFGLFVGAIVALVFAWRGN